MEFHGSIFLYLMFLDTLCIKAGKCLCTNVYGFVHFIMYPLGNLASLIFSGVSTVPFLQN